MKLLYTKSFQNRLNRHIEYIALKNYKAAERLKNEILKKTKGIIDNPYKHRKSIYFDDQQIRDLIHKGCTVVFKIEEERIVVFGFLKHQESPID